MINPFWNENNGCFCWYFIDIVIHVLFDKWKISVILQLKRYHNIYYCLTLWTWWYKIWIGKDISYSVWRVVNIKAFFYNDTLIMFKNEERNLCCIMLLLSSYCETKFKLINDVGKIQTGLANTSKRNKRPLRNNTALLCPKLVDLI